MNIRKMRREDISGIAAWMVTIPLWQRYELTEQGAISRFEAALAGNDLLFVAEDESGEVCGFAWCIPGGAFGRSAYLRLIGVRPDQSRSGIGAQLLDQIERSITSSDLFLLVSDFNVDAQRFYRRQGYEMVGSIPGYVLPSVTELIFRKRIH